MKFRIKHLTLATIIAIGGGVAYVSNTAFAHTESNKSLLTENIEALSQSPEGGSGSSNPCPNNTGYIKDRQETPIPYKVPTTIYTTEQVTADVGVQPQFSGAVCPGTLSKIGETTNFLGITVSITYSAWISKTEDLPWQKYDCSTVNPGACCDKSCIYRKDKLYDPNDYNTEGPR